VEVERLVVVELVQVVCMVVGIGVVVVLIVRIVALAVIGDRF
jgi:hypothetical protein